ncbi:MAG: hypothetical protein K8R54_00245 [Bacteroidales bacterium]|nr:hypothetical protein [Bacteroidales bacterium]
MTDITEITYQKKPGNFRNENRISFNDYLINNNNECLLDVKFFFAQAPDSTRLHKLTIKYEETDDSTNYMYEVEPFYITP